MSGHSKWSSIKHKKAATDAKRGKVFSKIIKALTVAARSGGGNPEDNPRLRTLVDKAKEANMPADTMERAIKKGTGELEGQQLEELYYEGYGPGGVALYVQVLTDNKNRAAASVRSTLTKGGGKMGAAGCTAYIFEPRGYLEVAKEGQSDDQILELAVEKGAEDVKPEGDTWAVTTDPGSYEAVKEGLKNGGFSIKNSDLTLMPKNTVPVAGSDAKKLLKLLENLEEEDDVQNVYANFDMDDSLLEEGSVD